MYSLRLLANKLVLLDVKYDSSYNACQFRENVAPDIEASHGFTIIKLADNLP